MSVTPVRRLVPLLLTALLLPLFALVAAPTAATAADEEPPPVEAYARYEGQKKCAPKAKPGTLTLRGVSREVALDTEFNGVAVDAFGTTRAGFTASTTISRKEFGITWNAALEAGGVMVSDKVRIDLDVEFTAPGSQH